MNVTFYGAVREVTGSMHLLFNGEDRILLDCGMFQGHRKESEQKNRILPVDPRIVTNIVLSHAHIDHSGRIPVMVYNGFSGRVISTRATAAACEYLLLDSAKIQESDAQYLNYKTLRSMLYQIKASRRTQKVSKAEHQRIKKLLKKGAHDLNSETISQLIRQYRLEEVQPLYSVPEAEQALAYFDAYPYNHPVIVGKDTTCTFYEAGHILGSAMAVIRTRENGRWFTIGFTGDIGRFGKPIIKDPATKFAEEDRSLDLLIMESTYGNRRHEPVGDLKYHLKQAVNGTIERGGCLIIPSFAFGRTQELLYLLHQLYDDREVRRIPVYVDSPLATKLTQVFAEHPEVYDRETHETFLRQGKNPFSFDQVNFVSSVEESMALMRDTRPHIVIASSGMCEAGRILHHLRYKIHDSRNTILIVGYMAANTLGRRLLEAGEAYAKSGRNGSPPLLKILNKTYPLKAHVVKLNGFSAHADKEEMLNFLERSNLNIKKIALVHGEEQQCLSFGEYLRAKGYSVSIPHMGETLNVT